MGNPRVMESFATLLFFTRYGGSVLSMNQGVLSFAKYNLVAK